MEEEPGKLIVHGIAESDRTNLLSTYAHTPQAYRESRGCVLPKTHRGQQLALALVGWVVRSE